MAGVHACARPAAQLAHSSGFRRGQAELRVSGFNTRERRATWWGTREYLRTRKEWIQSLGFWWTDKQEQEDFDSMVELGQKIMDHFVELCITVAKRLHDDGVISRSSGRPVPILVHELEYHDGIADATRRANPTGLTKEFEKWIADM